jgi:hypothetical protein
MTLRIQKGSHWNPDQEMSFVMKRALSSEGLERR